MTLYRKRRTGFMERVRNSALGLILISLVFMKRSVSMAEEMANVTATTEDQTGGHPSSGRTERSYDSRDTLEGGISVGRPPQQDNQPHVRPYFDEHVNKNLTYPTTKTAYVHCKVRNMGNIQISWVRQRDMQILTVGVYTYTSDRRFTSLHADNSEDWTLELKDPVRSDSGVYECQINTEPKKSLPIQLNIVAVETHIPEGPVLYVKAQSQVNITCCISHVLDKVAKSFVFWYHDGNTVAYDQRIKNNQDPNSTVVSSLYINSVAPEDAGVYVCKPSYATEANITLHVVDGEKPALMQHDRSNVSHATIPSLLIPLVIACGMFLFNVF